MAKKEKSLNHSNWSDAAMETFARCVWPDIVAYFNSEEGQKEFVEWQREQAMKADDTKVNQNKGA